MLFETSNLDQNDRLSRSRTQFTVLKRNEKGTMLLIARRRSFIVTNDKLLDDHVFGLHSQFSFTFKHPHLTHDNILMRKRERETLTLAWLRDITLCIKATHPRHVQEAWLKNWELLPCNISHDMYTYIHLFRLKVAWCLLINLQQPNLHEIKEVSQSPLIW